MTKAQVLRFYKITYVTLLPTTQSDIDVNDDIKRKAVELVLYHFNIRNYIACVIYFERYVGKIYNQS